MIAVTIVSAFLFILWSSESNIDFWIKYLWFLLMLLGIIGTVLF
jgi:hypothetical protein